jgi:8-amino-7-oxononanoate synthase
VDNDLTLELDDLRRRGLYRNLRRVETTPGPRVTLDGRDVIVFGSNNYLGLSTHPDVIAAAIDAARTWGAGSTGSRLTTGNLALHEELESEIAAFKGTESALVFGTGYMAGVGVLTALAGPGDLMLSDALNHASLIDGCRLSRAEIRVYRHNDIDHARSLIVDRARFRRCAIVTDGVFSMDGDIAPLAALKQLADDVDAWLIVDDAHGTGVLGENGRGSLEHCGVDGVGVVQMGTLSKALGSEGGFIAGSRVLIDYLINRARPFIFSTAPGPAGLAAASAALRVVSNEPERRQAVLKNAARLRSGLQSAGFDVPDGTTPIVPVILGDSEYAANFAATLLDHGVYVPAIRPPTVPEGSARLRMSVMSTHNAEDIDEAIEAMVKVRESRRS